MEGSHQSVEENNKMKQMLIEKLAKINVDEDWEEMKDCHVNANEKTDNSMKAFRRDGETTSRLVVKMDQTFPNIDPDTFWDMQSNFDTRSKWDSRW